MATLKALAAVALASALAASAADDDRGTDHGGAAISQPYPVDYWALRSVISNVEVSPDGEQLALMRIPSRDGNPVIEVYDASDLAAEPFRLDADPMEIQNLSWVNDNFIVFSARQRVRDIIEGFNQGVYEFKFGILDLAKKKVSEFGQPGEVGIASLLPGQPNKVVLAVLPPTDGRSDGERLSARFLPRDYYEYDLKRGTRKLLLQGKVALGNVTFDGEGHAWTALGFDLRKKEYVFYFRTQGTTDWQEIHRQHEDDFEDFSVLGFDVDDRNTLFVRAHNGHDKAGLWELDVASGEMTAVYQRNDVDVWGVVGHSNGWTEPDRITGVSYFKDKFYREYFDELEGATLAQLEGLVPHAHYLTITSRSRDGNTLTIRNVGPRDPGTDYLLKDGSLQTVGSAQPLLESEQLADVRYITYKARDGLTIPAFLTVPNGEPPFPLVVLPHGGPYVSEVVFFDRWGQLLANNGYLVLQPQYRGSQNYGLTFYKTAFINGGQGGYQMQDDKDDGAKYLVEQGLTTADRMAMFGWSYGGYAAAVAAARTPQIYQCVVAGAAVFDTLMQVNYYRFRLRGTGLVEQINTWDDSVSPIKEVANVNVPMLILHGSVDQRVPPAHVRRYLKRMDELGKTYKYVELDGADHFSNTLFYDHQLQFYTALLDFLRNDCGPEGL